LPSSSFSSYVRLVPMHKAQSASLLHDWPFDLWSLQTFLKGPSPLWQSPEAH
jgi:hypothetical protein